jgi:probable rRNA maturation factor
MPDSDSSVLFQCGAVRLHRSALRAFAERLRQEVARGRQFGCLFARDAELQRLNREFLGNDYPTDVLSFPSDTDNDFIGEIAISVDRAKQQAKEYGHTADEELRILMLHGVLHLMGMNHENDRGQMRRTEMRWRRVLELPAGLIERVQC